MLGDWNAGHQNLPAAAGRIRRINSVHVSGHGRKCHRGCRKSPGRRSLRAGAGLRAPARQRSRSTIPPTPATADDIAADFASVSAQPRAFAAPHYMQFTKLDLPGDAITSLLTSRVEAFTAQLVETFPNFNDYPAEACAAIFDMAFNLGLQKLLSAFPTFTKAVRNADWATAAAQCHRLPPISDDRNNWTQAQFLQAASDAAASPGS